MFMKIFRIVCLSAALATSSIALAKLSLPNGVLGQVEAALDSCAKANPQSAAKYEEKKKALVQGASEQEVAQARASQEYKEGYEAASQEMAKQSPDETKKMCSAALEQKK
jgi:hypothetical protein